MIRSAALILLVAGCHTDINGVDGDDLAQAVADMSETADLSHDGTQEGKDMSQADMTEGPDLLPAPPFFFNPDIQKDIDAIGCISSSCHQTKNPILVAHATQLGDLHNNYLALAQSARAGEQSLVLMKTLANSGVQHADNGPAAKPFATKSDPTYQRWLTWIQAGTLEQP